MKAPDRAVTFAPFGPVVVTGDANRLRQVVDNLVANAISHTPGATPIDVGLTVDGTTALLTVADEGPGIDPTDRAHIFEPFHRADPSRARSTGGVGLGLAIVSAIASAHGGTVGVDSEPGSGATFWVRLPLAPADVALPGGPPPAAQPSPTPPSSAPPSSPPPAPALPVQLAPPTAPSPPVPTVGGDPP